MAGVSRRGSVWWSVAESSLGISGGSMSERKEKLPASVFLTRFSHTTGVTSLLGLPGTEGVPRMWDLFSGKPV